MIGLALPIAAMTAGCTALSIWLFLYSKVDRLIAAAIVLADTGVAMNFLINEIVMRYVDKQYFNISVFITAGCFAVATMVLVIIAISRRAAMKKAKK